MMLPRLTMLLWRLASDAPDARAMRERAMPRFMPRYFDAARA